MICLPPGPGINLLDYLSVQLSDAPGALLFVPVYFVTRVILSTRRTRVRLLNLFPSTEECASYISLPTHLCLSVRF